MLHMLGQSLKLLGDPDWEVLCQGPGVVRRRGAFGMRRRAEEDTAGFPCAGQEPQTRRDRLPAHYAELFFR